MLAPYNGQGTGELGAGELGAGAGERGLPRGPATATESHKRAFEPEGTVLLAVHSRCVLCCFGSLCTILCLARSWISRSSVPAAENVWYTWHANWRTPTNSYVCGRVDFDFANNH